MDLHNTISYKVGVVPQTQTNADTAIVGRIIDMLGFESAEYIIATGTLTDAGCTVAVLLEEGAASNLSDAAAVADADLLGTEALAAFDQADDIAVRKLGYIGTKRYIRMTLTPTGNAAGDIPVAAVVALKPTNRKGVITDGGQAG